LVRHMIGFTGDSRWCLLVDVLLAGNRHFECENLDVAVCWTLTRLAAGPPVACLPGKARRSDAPSSRHVGRWGTTWVLFFRPCRRRRPPGRVSK
jgi:hypothetical protein